MKLKYFLCAIGYDAEGYVTDFEETLAEFKNEREACIAFDKFIWNENANEHFKAWTSVKDILLQVEKCEETEHSIECIDIIKEEWIENSNYKEV